MEKYQRMKNPPRFNGEWKYYAFYLFDLLTIGFFLMFARFFNNLFVLSFVAAFFNYLAAFIFSILMIWRPAQAPYQRQFFVIVESLLFSDRNHYHAIDPNRNYHGQKGE
ncbi:DUF5592 family protein [Enterococcus gilvus]|uniref:DUF5592 family protein n=1 Tax=Enterococcus gilvus TaxID=160453 RepID=UPI0028D1C613|nr:DUF5592 family protein [Enterococcus gilvus]